MRIWTSIFIALTLFGASAWGTTPAPMFQRSTSHGPVAITYAWDGPRLSPVGDIDGDGFDDIIYAYGTQFSVFLGSASGLQGPSTLPATGVPGPGIEVVAGAGDVNGDGFDDVIVGNPDNEIALIFLGSALGLNPSPSWTQTETMTEYGSRVEGAGDVNGDGFDDVLVSGTRALSLFSSDRCDLPGKVFLYLGGASGVSTTPQVIVEQQAPGCFGYAISPAGDANNDGFDDVLIGAPAEDWSRNGTTDIPGFGRTYLYLGSMSGLINPEAWSDRHPDLGGYGAFFGWSLDGAGDVDGDGFDDAVVRGYIGFEGFMAQNPRVEDYLFAYRGSAIPWASRDTVYVNKPTLPNQNGFSWSTSRAGDVNNDGFDDVIYVMPDQELQDAQNLPEQPDVVRVNLGSSSGLVKPRAWLLNPPWRTMNPRGGATKVSNAGDVDGDGYDDVIVMAQTEFRVYYGGENPTPIANAQTLSTPKNELLEVTLSGTDIYDDPLTFSITAEPTNGTLDTSQIGAGIVFYTPQRGFSGQDVFTFSATDPYGKTGEADVTIDVTNQPPEFVAPTPSEDIEVVVNDSVTFQLAAQDPESDFITYGIDPLPQDAQFDDISGEFFWRPAFTQELTLTLTASDNADSTSRELVIDVIAEMKADAGTPQDDAGMPDAGGEGDAGTQADAGQTDAGNLPAVSDDGCGCSTTPPFSRLSSLALLLIALTSARVLRRRRRKVLQLRV